MEAMEDAEILSEYMEEEEEEGGDAQGRRPQADGSPEHLSSLGSPNAWQVGLAVVGMAVFFLVMALVPSREDEAHDSKDKESDVKRKL